jgi:hypothetical protein
MRTREKKERRSFLRPVQSAWEQALQAFRVELREQLDRERPDAPSGVKEEIERRAVVTYENGLRSLVGRSSAEQEALAAQLVRAEASGKHRSRGWRSLKDRLARMLTPRS